MEAGSHLHWGFDPSFVIDNQHLCKVSTAVGPDFDIILRRLYRSMYSEHPEVLHRDNKEIVSTLEHEVNRFPDIQDFRAIQYHVMLDDICHMFIDERFDELLTDYISLYGGKPIDQLTPAEKNQLKMPVHFWTERIIEKELNDRYKHYAPDLREALRGIRGLRARIAQFLSEFYEDRGVKIHPRYLALAIDFGITCQLVRQRRGYIKYLPKAKYYTWRRSERPSLADRLTEYMFSGIVVNLFGSFEPVASFFVPNDSDQSKPIIGHQGRLYTEQLNSYLNGMPNQRQDSSSLIIK